MGAISGAPVRRQGRRDRGGEPDAPALARVARSFDISFWKASTTPWNFLRRQDTKGGRQTRRRTFGEPASKKRLREHVVAGMMTPPSPAALWAGAARRRRTPWLRRSRRLELLERRPELPSPFPCHRSSSWPGGHRRRRHRRSSYSRPCLRANAELPQSFESQWSRFLPSSLGPLAGRSRVLRCVVRRLTLATLGRLRGETSAGDAAPHRHSPRCVLLSGEGTGWTPGANELQRGSEGATSS